jgi:hypothetical protein
MGDRRVPHTRRSFNSAQQRSLRSLHTLGLRLKSVPIPPAALGRLASRSSTRNSPEEDGLQINACRSLRCSNRFHR